MQIGPLVFIFKFKTRHIKYGANFANYTICAKNMVQAQKRVSKKMTPSERFESVECLASTAD